MAAPKPQGPHAVPGGGRDTGVVNWINADLVTTSFRELKRCDALRIVSSNGTRMQNQKTSDDRVSELAGKSLGGILLFLIGWYCIKPFPLTSRAAILQK